jgi:translation initiation factor 2 alpha subunit (eIF-2alpha)
MIEIGDLVLCTVEKIEGTVVFVKIHDSQKDLDGSIVVSEIAPGRIRNLRDYVVPKKKIVCKVLRMTSQNIELSFRRVSQKERKEVMEIDKQEKSYRSIIKKVLGDKSEKMIQEILNKEKIYDLFQEAKENQKKLEEFFDKNDAEKILEILKTTQKQRKVIVKKEIRLSTTNPLGIELIKGILTDIKNAEIKYISAGRYSLITESSDPKASDNYLKEILLKIEKDAKKNDLNFQVV